MTHEEKETWIFLVVSVSTFACYLVWLIAQVLGTPAAEIAYVTPMLWAIGSAIATAIMGNIALSLTAPKAGKQRDGRDREIQRYGDYSGQFLVNIAGLAVVVMSMLRVDHFWIANTMYFAFVGTALITSVVKLRSYRTGFDPC